MEAGRPDGSPVPVIRGQDGKIQKKDLFGHAAGGSRMESGRMHE